MGFFRLFLVSSLVLGSLAIPVQKPASHSSCSSKCSGIQNNYLYQAGKAYVYELETETKVQTIGLDQTENLVKQKATVTINVQQPCDYAIQLSSVQIEGASVSDDWKQKLEQNPMRFSFDDGLIDHICPSENDPAWSVNIKRGILSTFQNALQGNSPQTKGHEIDVSGHCPTEYEIREEQGGRNVYRKKKLLNCKGFHGNYTAIRGTDYDINSQLQQTPLVDSDQQCQHTIRRQILQDATCTETHLFKPFNQNHKAAIKSTTVQKLTFKEEKDVDESAFIDIGVRKSLQFDHSEFTTEQSVEAAGRAQHMLNELCQSSGHSVRPETPSLFTSLVYNLRKMEESELQQLWENAKLNKNCGKEKKFMLDAIPMCGSESCVKMMVQLLLTTELNTAEKHVFYISFAFVPRVTSEMVSNVLPLVESSHLKGLLGVSSLVHTFCRQNVRCTENPHVVQFMQTLEQKLGSDCEASGMQEIEKIVLVLKSIGNVGYYGSIIPVLQKCFEKPSNPKEIRLAAMNALRRMPCDQDSLNSLWNVYEKTAVDSELRITAFIELMRCPDQENFVEKLQSSIRRETVNQVGSFVYSFIKNKRDSNDPTQVQLQSLLQKVKLERHFDKDPRKFSKFVEIGQFSHEMNLGGKLEQAAIFTPESMIPRNVFANLTVHLFGSSVNLLELGGRQEGLEKLLDSMFGPEGYFTNPNGYEFQRKPKGQKSSRMQSLDDMFKKRSYYRPHNKLALSMYVKVFGDELAYFGFDGENVMDDLRALMDVEKILSSLAEGKEVKLTKNIMFADSVKTIPTVSGLPLRIAINGTASIDLDVSGKMDLTKVLKRKPGQPLDLNIMAKVRPSAAVEISTVFALQVDNARTGIKMVSRLHTSTAIDTNVEFVQGKLLKTKVSLPKDKMEIIDIQSELFNVADNTHSSFGVQHSKVHTMCTPNTFNKAVLLKFCAVAQAAKSTKESPYSLLNGPSRVMFTAEKSDKKLNSYEMEMEWAEQGYPKRFMFNTPGSEVDREIRVQIDHQKAENKLNVDIRSPFKRLQFEGQWTNLEPNKGRGTLAMTIDNKEKYELDLNAESINYGVMIEATGRMPGRKPVTVKYETNCRGTLADTHNVPICQEFDMETKMTGFYDDPIEFKARYSVHQPIDAELSWRCPASEARVKLSGKSESGVSGEHTRNGLLDISYKRTKTGKTHRVKLETKLDTKRPVEGSYELLETTKLETTDFPELNFEGGAHVKVSPKKILYKYGINYGIETKKKLLVMVDGQKTSEHKREIDFNLQWDSYDISEKGKIVIERNYPTKFLVSVESLGGRNDQRRLFSEVRFTQSQGNQLGMESEARLEYPGREMRLFYEMSEPKANEYKTKLIAQWQVGKQIEIDSDIRWKRQRDEYEYMITSVAKMTGKPDKIRFLKHIQQTKSDVTYTAYTKKGAESLYDLKLHIKEQNDNEYKITSHFKSNYIQNTDLGIDGELKTGNHQYDLNANVKRDQKEYAKVHLMTPSRLSQITSKKLKAQLMWDLDSQEPKELMAEYKGAKGTPQRHELTLKSQLNDDNYRLNVKAQLGDVYMFNTTYVHNNRPLLETGLGLIVSGPFQIDVGFQTHHPWTKRHYTGLVVVQYDSGKPTQGKLELELKCHTSNKGLLVLMDSQKPNENTRKITVRGQMGDFGVGLNGNVISDCEDYYGKCDFELDYSGVVSWSKTKKIEQDGHYEWKSAGKEKDSFGVNFWHQLKTPFDVAKQAKVEISLKQIQREHFMADLMFEHNDKQKFDIELSSTGNAMKDSKMVPGSLNLKLTTDSDRLSKAHLKIDHDVSTGVTVDSKLTWNEGNEIGASFKLRSDAGLFAANVQIPSQKVDWRLRTDGEYDRSQQKLIGNMQVKVNNDHYKLGMDVDGKAGTGIFKLQTPFDQWKTGKVEVTRVSDGEYKIETEKNGVKMGSVKGHIRTTGTTRLSAFKLEVTEVSKPFDLLVEKVNGPQSRIRFRLVMSPNTEKQKVYGVDLMIERTSEFDCKMRIDADHRYMELTYLKGQELISQDVPLNWKLEIQLNGKSSRKPTLLIMGPVKGLNGKLTGTNYKTYDVLLSDPNLSKPIKLTLRKERTGRNEDYSMILDYSGESSKTLTCTVSFMKVSVASSELSSDMSDNTRRIELSVGHAATNLHYKMWLEYVEGSSFMYNLLTGVEYKNRINEVRQWEIKYEMPNDREIRLRLSGTESVYRLIGKIIDRNGQYQLKFTIDNIPVFVVSTIYNNNRIELEVRESENSDIFFHASARMVNKNVAQISIWHTERGKRLDDGDIRVELDKADLLKTKFFVRPGIHREIRFAAEKGYDRLNSMSRYSTGGKYQYETPEFINQLTEKTKPMIDSWIEEQINFSQELGPAVETLRQQLSEFGQLLKELFLAMVDIVEQTVDDIVKTVPGNGLQSSYKKMKENWRDMGKNLDEVSRSLQRSFRQLVEVLDKVSQKTEEYKQRTWRFFDENFDMSQIQDFISESWDSLSNSEIALKTNEYLRSLNVDPETMKRRASELMDVLFRKLTKWARNVQSYAGQWEDTLSDNPVYYSLIKPMFDVKSVNLEQRVKDYVQNMRDEMLNKFSPQRYIPRVTVNNPEDGYYEVEFPLPVKSNSLKHLTQQMDSQRLERIKDKIQDHVSEWSDQMLEAGEETGYGIIDQVYQYKPRTWEVKDWIPPFAQTAYLIGNQHIVTFDGKVFDFSADCDYLLASDFYQNKFLVTASFGKKGAETILEKITAQLVGGKVEISNDGTVKVNDDATELPWQKYEKVDNAVLLQVKRKGHTIVVKTFDGIKIKFNSYYHVCQITLPGRYHGQSAGLLGSNDNEPHNDLYLPDGSDNDQVDIFAQKWHTSGQSCDAKPSNVHTGKIGEDHQMYSECQQYFMDKSSPFRHCFRAVKPSPFMEMCLTDMHRHTSMFSVERHSEGICNVSAAYLMACKRKTGLEVDVLPSQCVRCDNPTQSGTQMTESDDTVELRNSEKLKIDIVLVVQESPRMEFVKNKLLQITNKFLQKFGSVNVNFGLIGFGGQGVHEKPHFHTGNHRINFEQDDLESAFEGLEFGQSETARGPMEALMFAAKYPFRPGAMKSVVLLTSSKCKGQKIDYYDLQQEFLNLDIKFNMLTLQDIRLAKKTPTETAIGFDARHMYLQGGEMRRDLRLELAEPHDSCTVLAQETNGTVFTISQSLPVTFSSEKIAQKLDEQLQFNECQICECTIERFTPTTMCFPCHVPRPVSLTEKSFFNLPYMKLRQKLEDWELL